MERVSWATYNEWKAAIVTEAFGPEGRLSVSIDMGVNLHEGGSSSLLQGMSTARKYTTDYFFKQFHLTAPEVPWDEFGGTARVPTPIMKLIGRRMKPKPPCRVPGIGLECGIRRRRGIWRFV